MNRIVCFADSGAVASTIQHLLTGHDIHIMSASRLTNDVRSTVEHIAPDIILLELNRSMDNAHLYFFLRADQATRSTPVILVSPTDIAAQHAAVLNPDDVLSRTQLAADLLPTVTRFLPKERAAAA